MKDPREASRIIFTTVRELFFIGLLATAVSMGLLVASNALGWPLSVSGPGYVRLKDGTRVHFANREEARLVKAQYRDRIAGGTNTSIDTPASWIVMLSPFLIVGGCLSYRCRHRLRTWFDVEPKTVAFGLAVVGGALAVSWVYRWLAGELGTKVPPFPLRPADPFGWFAFSVGVIVLAPFVEEMVFRGRLWEAVETAIGRRAALVSTSLVFAVLHMPFAALVLAPIYLMLAFTIGWARIRTGNLVAPVVIHVVNNAAFVVSLAYSSPPPQ